MSVPIRLKRLTVGALGIVALVLAGLFVAPYFISHNEARLAVIRAVHGATGVEPQIAGAVHLSLLPTPAVQLEEVRLADGTRPPFAASAIQASVRLLPLLIGRVEIASVTFRHPHLLVDTAADGSMALGLPMRRSAANGQAELPEIRFENGTVQFRGGNYAEPLTHVDAAVASAGAGLNATGSFQWRGQPAAFSLSISDLTALERGNRSAVRLRVDGEALKLGFDGGVAYRNGLQADGTVAAEATSLRTVLTQLLATPPVTRGGFGPFKLKGQLAIAANTASVTKLAVELDGNRAEGGLTIKPSGERMAVQATLATDLADFTAYSGGFAMTDESGRDWSRELIDLSGLDSLDLDMRFSAARVLVRKTELARVAATASVRSGTLTLTLGDARFHGGALRGRATIGRNLAGEADVRIEGSVTNFDLAPGLATLANVSNLEGKGNLNVALRSHGDHMQALTSDLDGTVTLEASGGALTGINIEQVLRKLERNPIAATAGLGGGRTAFDRLNARLRVLDGTALVEDARIENAQMRVRLSGETSVVHRDFNLNGLATLLRSAAAQFEEPFEFPFMVRGPWAQPYLLPDPATLIRRSGDAEPFASPLRQALR
ncbi:MAG TPA: AsmA family protein [Xanthobacteraceae bacterium]|nr:AsmA family protein [Xanthobacteraceae bacterium]